MSEHSAEKDRIESPTVTPIEDRRETCPRPGFGRPHTWTIGAFYWPLAGQMDGTAQLYVGDDYVMCARCGQIEED